MTADQRRDWEKEMAAIDRAIEQQGPGAAPPGGALTPRAATPAAGPAPSRAAVPARRGSVAITWLWTVLAVALAIALPLWPYQRACGLQTIFFLGATGITALVGGLAAVSSWRNRRGLAHLLSLVVVAWAGAVAASEILPRVGYAREARTWTCADEPASAPTTAPAPTTTPAPRPSDPAAGDASPPSP